MVSSAVVGALRQAQRDRSDTDEHDDFLRKVIRQVESALGSLRPSVTEVSYALPDRTLHWLQLSTNREGRWFIAWRRDSTSTYVALLSTARSVRCEVFSPGAWSDAIEGTSPIESLILAVTDELSKENRAREPAMVAAERILNTLSAASFAVDDAGPGAP